MFALRPPISFIIPAYNCAGVIGEAVGSILDRNLEPADEVIVVDDCSTDTTPEVLTTLQAKHRSIRILKHRQNKGTAAAGRNTGIEAAAHDLLFCLDTDNVLEPGSIGALREHLQMTGADTAAFGEIHFFQTSTTEITHKWIFKPEIRLADALSGTIWPGPSGNYLFTRDSWLRAGRYHEPSLENRSLDSWIFAIRQLGTGSRFVTLPGTWYLHRYGHDSHYVLNWRRGNQSLAALIGLIPLLPLLEDRDIEYLFSSKGRYNWYEHLHDHPVRVKNAVEGTSGEVQYMQIPRRWRFHNLADRALIRARKWWRGGGH
jgi:glycosyltransferase involved in cell wall biosynthesis